jgi:aminoglycoside phosphotransferase family enzyme
MKPEAYPDQPKGIDAVETHMSWVFLTDRHAYKLKKPVRYDFLDFSTPEARRRDCAKEVRLNRRLAPDVYLGVVRLTEDSDAHIRVTGSGRVIDWLVKMRKLPAHRMFDYMIHEGSLRESHVRTVALLLARYYCSRPPAPVSSKEYRRRLEDGVQANFEELADPAFDLPAPLVEGLRDAQLECLQRRAPLFDRRAAHGMITEGHGDLRPEHICMEEHPVIFDCLEFNEQFRIIDRADELAFLTLECDRIGALYVGRELFRAYGSATDDYPPEPLIAFYQTFRACLRAKLAIRHTRELDMAEWPKWRNRAVEYLQSADAYASNL